MIAEYHNFKIDLAKKCGVDNAIFLQDIAYWIDYNSSGNVNFREGRYWTYSTMEAICERHPYWTKRQVQRIVKNCLENKWLFIGKYNKSNYDHTNWYSVSDEILSIISGKSLEQDSFPDDTKPLYQENDSVCSYIDKINKENKKTNTTVQTNIFNKIQFEAFWSLYPRKQAKQDAIKAWNALKPDEEFYEFTIEPALKKQIKSDQWTKDNGKFISLPASWIRGRRWEDETFDLNCKPKKEEVLGVGPGWW